MIQLPILTDKDWDATNNYISKSRCQLFDFCGIKYKKQYIDRTLPRDDGSHASTIGTRFHEFAELFMGVAHKYPMEKWKSFIHPDFTEEERAMLEWFIDLEMQRSTDHWTPLAMEYRVINHDKLIRGIIDRIDQIDDKTIEVIEYKTTQKINKQKLMFEFGFYDLLLMNVPELQGFDRRYKVINPRLREVVSFNPSRLATIVKKINGLNECITTNSFKPKCKLEYATSYCNICTMEELAEYNGIKHYCSD